MENATVVSTPLVAHFKLSSGHNPSNEAEKTNMSRVPYASTVGSLMYAMVCTRLDIAHAVGTISRFFREHWNVVKWILRYLHGTSDLRLCFGGDKPTLVGYSDSDMAGDIDSRNLQGELWLDNLTCKSVLLCPLPRQSLLPIQKYARSCFGQSAIHLGKNSTFHSRSKHINVRYHWICDAFDAKLLELAKVHTGDNGADMMTKVVPRGNFEACCEIAGLTITYT
ncbi:hypothetical protein CR513_37284, partial [Mucuna pruriens]